MPRSPFLTVLALSFLAPVAFAQEAADAAALEFLEGLGDSVEKEILGEEVLVIRIGPNALGEMSLDIASEELHGREIYVVRAQARMDLPGGVTHSMKAETRLASDLTILEGTSREVEAQGDQEKVKETTFGRTDGGLKIHRVEDGKESVWDLPPAPGLIDEGAAFALYGLLARANPSAGTTMTFLGRHQGALHRTTVEALGPSEARTDAGTFEVVGFRTTSPEWDDETGEPEIGEDGKQSKKVLEHYATPEGRLVLVRFVGTPLRLEAKGEEGAGPSGDAHPAIGTVGTYFLAMAEGDVDALEEIIEWPAIYEAWSKGPGRERLAGMSEEEVAELKKGFARNFSNGMLSSIDDDAREGVRILSAASYWEAQEQADGTVLVRITEEMRNADESMASLSFRLARGKDGNWRIVQLPGL